MANLPPEPEFLYQILFTVCQPYSMLSDLILRTLTLKSELKKKKKK